MEKLESILVAVDRNPTARHALEKAVAVADHFRVRVELFLCDAERAYALKHEYDARGSDEARTTCLAESRRYLEELRASVDVGQLQVSIDVACESPLYEGIVHKVLRSRPDLVIRGIGGVDANGPDALGEADWALVRTCPVPLMLTRGKAWTRPLNAAVAVDVACEETPELTRAILQAAAFLQAGCGGTLDVLYGADEVASAPRTESCSALLLRQTVEAGARAEHIHVLAGEPGQTLPQFAATRRYDVLVLGALTHRKALTALVGTLTGRLLNTLDCDFLLVKPPGYVCPVALPPDA